MSIWLAVGMTRTIWQCNAKFKGESKCVTPHLYEQRIKELFLEAAGILMKKREDVIGDCREVMETLADCGSIDTEMEAVSILVLEVTDKSGFYGDKYENTIFNWRDNRSWQNNSKPAAKKNLTNSVFLDGDWCWDASPFQVTEETKEMVVHNICYLLNNFLHCSVYENVIFCWVMHEQSIIDRIMEKLDTENCKVKKISLIADESNLRDRLTADVISGIRTADVISRSIARTFMYQTLDTIKIDTSNKTVQAIADEIMML